MQFYQGLQVVYVHVISLIRSINNWFVNIEWSAIIEQMPLGMQTTITTLFVVVLAMSAIGLVKKLSFLLG